MQDNKPLQLKALLKGVAPSVANNILPEGLFLFGKNIIVREEGSIEGRPLLFPNAQTIGLSDDNSIHSLKRLNSGTSSIRIAASTTLLFAETSVGLLEQISSGFSGKPLTFLDFRPELATSSYCFVGDTSKMCKVAIDGTVQNLGIATPTAPLTWKVSPPLRKVIDQLGASTTGSWTASAGTKSVVPKVNTTIEAILYDTGTDGFCSIVPTSSENIHEGTILTIGTAPTENIIAESVMTPVIPTGATVQAITYLAGGLTGECIITPSLSSPFLKLNSILKLNATEHVRISEILPSNEGIPSFKCTTTTSIAVGQSIESVFSFRCVTLSTRITTDPLITDSLKLAIAASGITTLTRNITEDLTAISERNLTPDDFIFVALNFSTLATLTELQLQFDVDRSTNNFTHNYYWYAIRPNDLLQAQLQVQSVLSVQQQIAQIQQLYQILRPNDFGGLLREDPYQIYLDPTVPIEPIIVNPSDQTALGANQWSIFKIRIGDFQRVGSDTSQSFRDVKSIRFSAKTTGAVDIIFDSLWLGGGFQLSGLREGFLPLNYIYRYGNKETKERSGWSPPLRTWIEEKRNRLELTPVPSTDPQVDIIEIARIGSALNSFFMLGSTPNDGTPFIDDISDATAARGSRVNLDWFQLFTLRLPSISGTCNVNGTLLTNAGTPFNLNMVRGTTIIVNGSVNSTYTKPTDSGTKVELENSMGSLTNVSYFIPEPVVEGQPLHLLNGVVGEGSSGLYIFGIDDTTLYWSYGNTGSAMSESNFLEITNPSEKLLNGAFWDSSLYLWTNERGFQVLSSPVTTANGITSRTFYAKENAGTRGLLSRYAITSSEHGIFYLSDDGIYQIFGSGNSTNISEGFLQSLFPKGGATPTPIILSPTLTLYPPDYTQENATRLFYANNYLFFKYLNTNAEHVCLVYDITNTRWLGLWTFFQQINCIYGDEGANIYTTTFGGEGTLLTPSILSTLEADVQAALLTGAYDLGFPNTLKRFDSIILDSIPKGLQVTPLFDYHGLEGDTEMLSSDERTQSSVSLEGIESRSIGLQLDWTLQQRTKIYQMDILFHMIGAISTDTITPFDDANAPLKDKLWQGIIIKGSTFGKDKMLKFYTDDNTATPVATLIINHSETEQVRSYSFPTPFIAHSVQLRTSDSVEWLLIDYRYVNDLEPERAKVWEGEFNAHNLSGYKIISRISPCYSCESNVDLLITLDDGTTISQQFSATQGQVQRHTKFITARKSRLFKYRFSSDEEFPLYRSLSEVIIHSFSGQAPPQVIVPFGDDSPQTEIRI